MSVRIASRSGVYRLRSWHEAQDRLDAAAEPVLPIDFRNDAAGALAFVRALAGSPGGAGQLRALLAQGGGAVFRLEDDDVLQKLAVRLASGALVAERVMPPALPSFDVGTDEVEAASIPPPKAEEKTWIEIELVDQDGNPVPNERYWILLTDGTTREGRLDSQGRAYFGNLDAGECEVRFPDLDNDAVGSPGEGALKPLKLPPRKPKTWIEIELVGMDGSPIPGEAYKLKLPDGQIKEGRLDERGRARVDDLDPGTCTVCFPALDEEAWEAV